MMYYQQYHRMTERIVSLIRLLCTNIEVNFVLIAEFLNHIKLFFQEYLRFRAIAFSL
jgi:hypothetical protein